MNNVKIELKNVKDIKRREKSLKQCEKDVPKKCKKVKNTRIIGLKDLSTCIN